MADNVFLIQLHYSLHGQLCQNGYWFRSSPSCGLTFADTLAELTQLSLQFKNTVYAKIRAFCSQQVEFIRLDGTTKEPLFGPVTSDPLQGQFGTHLGESAPGFTSGLLTLYTGNGGRQNHGRSYYSGVPEDQMADGKLSPIQFTELDEIGFELMLRFGPNTTNPCWRYQLFHQHQFSQGVAIRNAISPITNTVARLHLRTQRKRMIGVGS